MAEMREGLGPAEVAMLRESEHSSLGLSASTTHVFSCAE